MKRYRLKKDLPTFKAGETFVLWNTIETEGLCRESDGIMAYHQRTLDKFPNILEEWFEEIKPAEPLIKDEKIRKAVRAWAEVNKISRCVCKDEIHCITFETERGMFISFEYADPIPPEGNYTIAELCGEKEDE